MPDTVKQERVMVKEDMVKAGVQKVRNVKERLRIAERGDGRAGHTVEITQKTIARIRST